MKEIQNEKLINNKFMIYLCNIAEKEIISPKKPQSVLMKSADFGLRRKWGASEQENDVEYFPPKTQPTQDSVIY